MISGCLSVRLARSGKPRLEHLGDIRITVIGACAASPATANAIARRSPCD
jgi:hypothetical protein